MDEFPLALQFSSLMRLVRPEHRAFGLIQRLRRRAHSDLRSGDGPVKRSAIADPQPL
jgi:hypothetical protein